MKMKKKCEAAARLTKFRRTALRTVIKISGPRDAFNNPGCLRPTDRKPDQPKLTCLHIQLHATSDSVYPTSPS
jgi:hypothetical protein